MNKNAPGAQTYLVAAADTVPPWMTFLEEEYTRQWKSRDTLQGTGPPPVLVPTASTETSDVPGIPPFERPDTPRASMASQTHGHDANTVAPTPPLPTPPEVLQWLGESLTPQAQANLEGAIPSDPAQTIPPSRTEDAGHVEQTPAGDEGLSNDEDGDAGDDDLESRPQLLDEPDTEGERRDATGATFGF